MKKNVKVDKRKLEREVTETTSIEINAEPQNHHSLKIRGKEVDLMCSNRGWITLSPIVDITLDLRFCPHCGQRVVTEILYYKLKALIPEGAPMTLQG